MRTPSLLDQFEPPQSYLGAFGWICGYSADAAFLDAAVERFTRRTAALRAQDGKTSLVLMLDPSQPQISLLDVPGLTHLPLLGSDVRPFRLLHAKVALLGFRAPESANDWCLRLVVTTGNWTTQTLEDSLDLVWAIELRASELTAIAANVAQRCADMLAASAMLTWLRQHFDQRLLGAARLANDRFQTWLDALGRHKPKVRPRFFDSRNQSLLAQIPALVQGHAGAQRRNYLALGSGFFESDTKGDVPSVLSRIVETLTNEGLLTQSAEIAVFVNELACQAVASSVEPINARGWRVYAAAAPSEIFGQNDRRTLHAKFLFGANSRQDSITCSSGWVYMGSGNLTDPGFNSKASFRRGNLEAGVVFDPGEMVWQAGVNAAGVPVVTQRLPIHWGDPLTPGTPQCGGDEPPQADSVYLAGPLALLTWQSAEGSTLFGEEQRGVLSAPDGPHAEVQVLDTLGRPCAVSSAGSWCWDGPCPRQVTVRWEDGRAERQIPVQDQWGRLAPLQLAALQLDELTSLIAAFPAAGSADDDTADSDDSVALAYSEFAIIRSPAATATNSSAIRQMMGHLEHIALKQTALDESDWLAWCARFEQLMVQASQSKVLLEFRELGINPLSALRATPFLPAYAHDANSDPRKSYEAALARVEQAWKVGELTPMRGAE